MLAEVGQHVRLLSWCVCDGDSVLLLPVTAKHGVTLLRVWCGLKLVLHLSLSLSLSLCLCLSLRCWLVQRTR